MPSRFLLERLVWTLQLFMLPVTQSFQGKAFGPSRLAWMHLILLPFTMSSSFSPIFTSCLKRPCTVSYLFWTTGIWRRTRFKHIQASKRFWQPWKGNPSCRKAFYTPLKPMERLFAFLANKQLHLIRKILRISGHINHTHHVQLGSQEVLVANGLAVPYHGYHGGGKTIPWKSSLKDHASNAAKSIDTNFRGLNFLGEKILDARVWPLKGFTSSYGFGCFVGCKKQAMLDEGAWKQKPRYAWDSQDIQRNSTLSLKQLTVMATACRRLTIMAADIMPL